MGVRERTGGSPAQARGLNAGKAQLQKRKADRTAVLASLRKHRLTRREETRLQRLTTIDRAIGKVETQIEMGQMGEEVGERRIRRMAAAA